MSDLACDEIDAVAAELALGILSGDERADALRHLAGCPACRDKVDEMAHVADQLLLVAPEEEPPIGFESRVLDRIAAERHPSQPAPAVPPPGITRIHRWRRWTTGAMAVAAAVVIVAAVLTGMAAGRARDRSSHSAVRVAVATFGHGGWVCRATVFSGTGTQPTSLIVRLDEPDQPTPNWYQVQAEPAAGGAPVPVGTIEVKSGTGLLNTSVPASAGTVRSIRVLDDHGVRYQAVFTAA